MTKPARIENADIVLKANIYFDGKVVSHTIENKDGSKQTAGLIYAGTYNFGTNAAERMDIIAGSCKVRLKGQTGWAVYNEGSYFEVPAKSAFDITVEKGITEYLCTYIQ